MTSLSFAELTRHAVATTLGANVLGNPALAAKPAAGAQAGKPAGGPYNILFKKGIVFENHRINSCVCTPSRSLVYTGRPIRTR